MGTKEEIDIGSEKVKRNVSSSHSGIVDTIRLYVINITRSWQTL